MQCFFFVRETTFHWIWRVISTFAFQLQCSTYLVFHRLLFFPFTAFSLYRFFPFPLFPSSVVFHSMLLPSTKFSLYPPLILSRLPISSMLTYFVDKPNSRCEWQIRKIPWNKQKELNFIAIYIHRASKTIFADLLFPLSRFACSFIADRWSWGQYTSASSFSKKNTNFYHYHMFALSLSFALSSSCPLLFQSQYSEHHFVWMPSLPFQMTNTKFCVE